MGDFGGRVGWRRRVFLLGKALEYNAVHSQCWRISYKRKGDDAPLIFGVALADIRSGERAELALSA